jgi:hypothetical protein
MPARRLIRGSALPDGPQRMAVLHKVTTQPSLRRETVSFFTILHDELKGRAAAAG